jgi:hypothetical protein
MFINLISFNRLNIFFCSKSDTEIGRIGRELSERFENFLSAHLCEYSKSALMNSVSGTRLNESTACMGHSNSSLLSKAIASPASFSSENSNSSYTCDSNSQTNLSVNNDPQSSSRPPRNKRKRTSNNDDK